MSLEVDGYPAQADANVACVRCEKKEMGDGPGVVHVLWLVQPGCTGGRAPCSMAGSCLRNLFKGLRGFMLELDDFTKPPSECVDQDLSAEAQQCSLDARIGRGWGRLDWDFEDAPQS